MNSDSLHLTGSSHHICEDYSMTCDKRESIAIISDGCSSSEDTDVGSVLLARSAYNVITRYNLLFTKDKDNWFGRNVTSLAYQTATSINMKKTCLDATLMILYGSKENKIYCYVRGDGNIVVNLKDGSYIVLNINYSENYPYYLSYEIGTDRKDSWNKLSNNEMIIDLSMISSDGAITTLSYKDSNELLLCDVSEWPARLGITSDAEYVSIASDGIESVLEAVETETSKSYKNVPLHEVVPNLFCFKNHKGDFVKRRLNRFQKDCEKQGWKHTDDLSVASIYVGD